MKKKKSIPNQNRKRMMLILLTIVIMSIVLFVGISPRNSVTTAGPDAFSLTATSIIEQITKDAIVLTDVALGLTTLTPSPTPITIDILQEQWLKDIETELGFSHPRLKQVVTDLTLQYDGDLERANQMSLHKDIRWHSTEEFSYVAIDIQTNFFDTQNYGNMLVFYIADENIDIIYDFPSGDSYFLLYGPYGELFDMNNNGNMDLVFAHSNGTECSASHLAILELAHGEIHDISPIKSEQRDTQYFSFWIQDSNEDSILEVVYQLPFIYKGDSDSQPCLISNEIFQYQWNGERYALVNQP